MGFTCLTVKFTTVFISIACIVGGACTIFLGITFSTSSSTLFGNKISLGIGFDIYGGFFILLGIFGILVTHMKNHGCMILFLFLSILTSCSFVGYGSYVISQLGIPIDLGFGLNISLAVHHHRRTTVRNLHSDPLPGNFDRTGEYGINIKLGGRGPFYLIVDTGSSDLGVATKECFGCE